MGEALTNAIEHAYPPGTESTVELDAGYDDGVVTITVRDHGSGDRRQRHRINGRGRGFLIMRNLADVAVHHDDDGTTVELKTPLEYDEWTTSR